jgi:hypothetical protein
MKLLFFKYFTGITTMCSAFLMPIKSYLFLVGFAVLLDAVIAIYTAVKDGGHTAFKSKRLKDTVAKSAIYFLAIILSRHIDLAFELDFALKVMAGTVLLIEMRSVDEKYFKLYGKSLFKVLIDHLPNVNKEKDKAENE